VNGLALCAGIGGIELGIRSVLRSYRTVAYVEREAFAGAVLVKAMEEGRLDQAPIWNDLATFDARPWRGTVDLVTTGIPCQPYSVAGKLRRNTDERAIWPQLVRIAGECGPAAIFIENVPGFLRDSEPLWSALRGLGFQAAAPLLSTSTEYGGVSIRKRVFLLFTNPDRARLLEWEGISGNDGKRISTTERGRGFPADSDQRRRCVQWSGWLFDRERQTLRHDAYRCSARCRICGSPWSAESPVVRVDPGTPDRLDRLYVIGNSVCPIQVADAFRVLCSRLPWNVGATT
jgi:site-specific DNA-cytosine methylase